MAKVKTPPKRPPRQERVKQWLGKEGNFRPSLWYFWLVSVGIFPIFTMPAPTPKNVGTSQKLYM